MRGSALGGPSGVSEVHLSQAVPASQEGQATFKVKAVYSNGSGNASDPAKYSWKVK
jgi:hypothetical protein